jgi:hypothetical protein
MGQALTPWRRHVGYATPSRFGGLGLKTKDGRFARFGPQNLRILDACGIIRERVSRQSDFRKGS